uniref:Uncharacterized protein n=1 Tax=Anguilla anguilla TaxID=7936 RepID=A0A0E9RGE3_ANGAN
MKANGTSSPSLRPSVEVLTDRSWRAINKTFQRHLHQGLEMYFRRPISK